MSHGSEPLVSGGSICDLDQVTQPQADTLGLEDLRVTVCGTGDVDIDGKTVSLDKVAGLFGGETPVVPLPYTQPVGNIDFSYTLFPNSFIYTIENVDNKIGIGGNFTTLSGTNNLRYGLLNADGTYYQGQNNFAIGSNFTNPTAASTVWGSFYYNNYLYVYGGLPNTNGLDNDIGKYLYTNQNLDTSFVYNIGVRYGHIIYNGNKIVTFGNGVSYVIMHDTNGFTDAGWVSVTGGGTAFSGVQVGLQILAGGNITNAGGSGINRLILLNSDGTLDVSFNLNIDGATINKVVKLSDGKILIGGDFTTVGGFVYRGLARLNSDLTVDTSFNDPNAYSGIGFGVREIEIAPDGKILIGGGFNTISGVAYQKFGLLQSNGLLDISIPNMLFNNDVYAINILSTGGVLVGGTFTTVNGISKPYLVKII